MNELDRIKEKKFAKMTEEEKKTQIIFFRKWCHDMENRKTKGNEKYGDYMMKIDDKTSFEELREEMLDVCNHLVMLVYKLEKVFVKK